MIRIVFSLPNAHMREKEDNNKKKKFDKCYKKDKKYTKKKSYGHVHVG
jgi:hypothetical protein